MGKQILLVNRDEERKQIHQHLDDVQHEPATPHVINVCGIPGIGKSTLLQAIAAELRDQTWSLTLSVDLRKVERRDLHGAKLQFLAELAQHDGDPRLAEPMQALAPASDARDERELDDALAAFAQALAARPEPIVIIADTWDHVPELLFAWVEYHLLLTLIARHKRVVCLVGSQAPLRWRQYEVRRRVELIKLEPLERRYVAEQLRDVDAPLDTIFALTAGHPRSNVIVRDLLRAQVDPEAWLAEHRGRVAQQLCAILIEEIAAQTSAADEPELLVAVFRVAAVLREFDLHSLNKLIWLLRPEGQRPSRSALMLIVRELTEQYIVAWSEETKSYKLAAPLRHIFAQELKLNDQKLDARLRAEAVRYYEELVGSVSANRDQFLVELIYHRLYKADPHIYNNPKPIEDLILDALQEYYGARAESGQAVSPTLRSLLLADPGLREVLQRPRLPRIDLAELLDRPTLLRERED